MKRFSVFLIVMLVLASLLVACGGATTEEPAPAAEEPAAEEPAAEEPAPEEPAADGPLAAIDMMPMT